MSLILSLENCCYGNYSLYLGATDGASEECYGRGPPARAECIPACSGHAMVGQPHGRRSHGPVPGPHSTGS